jgi:hypothetical protein
MSQKKAREARKEQAAQPKQQSKKKHRTRQDIILNIIIAAVILAVAGAGAYAVGSQIAKNRQEAAQTQQQGTDGEQQQQTIKTAAESQGISVADYLNEYGLAADTPETMPLGEAYNKMTVENVAKASGQSVEEFRQSTYLPDEVSDTMIWSEAQKEMPVRAMMSEEEFNQAKQEYSLGDDITLDMKWKDFLPIIQEQQTQVSGQPDDSQSGQSDSAPQQ